MKNFNFFNNIHKKHGLFKCLILLLIPLVLPFNSYAADNVENEIILSIEAFTVDYGFVLEPAVVRFDSTDNGATLIDKTFNTANINNGSGSGSYISSIALETDFININQAVSDVLDEKNISYESEIAKSGWLSEFDYTKQSGWLFIVNNSIYSAGIADYKPASGDVIRLTYSVYGLGADLALNTSGSALGSEANIFTDTNRDALFKAMGEYYENSDFELDAYVESIAVDLSAEQSDIDEAHEFMNGMIDDVEDANSSDDDDDEVETDDDDETVTEPDFSDDDEPAVTAAPAETAVPDISYEEYINNIPQADSAPTGVLIPISELIMFFSLSGISGLKVIFNRKNKK